MGRVVVALVFVTFASGISLAEEKWGAHFEHLKPHSPVIGMWRYDGPLLETIPGFASKGTKYTNELSWKWILDRNAIEITSFSKFEGDKSISGKGLIGWNAAKKEVAYGGMDSLGGMSVGTIEFLDDGQTSVLTTKGIDDRGREVEFTGKIEMTGEDSFTWQAVHRKGGSVNGPSPVYPFKRVEESP